jgi:hypothetical protein
MTRQRRRNNRGDSAALRVDAPVQVAARASESIAMR